MTKRCSAVEDRRPQDPEAKRPQDIALPILSETRPKMRASRVGKWRALALVLVHVLVAIHVAHWLETGRTMSPLEPSESMELSKRGLVNAGAIFFGLTIASTLVFGRWFCGWACHIVALQDGCRWLLRRMGIRPRMVNLGMLGAVPWLAFAYMFFAPILARLYAGEDLALHDVKLYTDSFWRTFPSWPVALVTFLACGFAIVYLLGSKAFCNYGCPYGAIFGVVDQLAPMRIRVTDACEGCGHCTATCTSNVKVHQEVRDHGMVVDPGCMKCLDCISVCPNDALYFGFGAPAIASTRRTNDRSKRGSKTTAKAAEISRALFFAALALGVGALVVLRSSQPSAASTLAPWHFVLAIAVLALAGALAIGRAARSGAWLARRALLLAFMFAASWVFASYSGEQSAYTLANQREVLPVALTLALFSFAVAGAFESRAERANDFTWIEELVLAVFFILAMLAVRGLDGWVPFLFALGLASMLAFAAVQGLRLLYRRDLALAAMTLKLGGKLTRAGVACAAVLGLVGVGWALAGARQRELSLAASEALHAQSQARDDALLARKIYNEGVESATANRLDDAIAKFTRALELDPSFLDARENLAGMLCANGRFAEGLAQYDAALLQNPDDADTHALAAQACAAMQEMDRAREHLLAATRLAPQRAELWSMLGDVEDARGDKAAADAARAKARGASAPNGR
jgi:tetratricopeptide (TPR) repeat protein/ferredoxin